MQDAREAESVATFGDARCRWGLEADWASRRTGGGDELLKKNQVEFQTTPWRKAEG